MAVPLFIFMGIMLEKSGMARELLETISRIFARIKGGLYLAILMVGTLMAASTGIIGATVVTMGVIALPTMLGKNYNKELSCGIIASSGTLGQIIPPSIVLVLLGDIMNVDVGNLFTGAVFPGLLLVAFYGIYIIARVTLNPDLAPAFQKKESGSEERGIWKDILTALVPPAFLIFIVLGSILGGLATPTEAAGCGAMGSLVIALLKSRASFQVLKSVLLDTTKMTSMVFTILVGAQFFGVVFRGLRGDHVIKNLFIDSQIPPGVILFAIMALMFFLGFFLDFIEICFIVIPVVMPVFLALNYDPLWLAILIAINLQTSFLTPPFGFALFYLKGAAPPGITTGQIYRGVIPFIGIQILMLFILAFFPALATWLPHKIFD